MKTQALQYDNGKYYYIEGGSTEDLAVRLIARFNPPLKKGVNAIFQEGVIYPVQVKVEIVERLIDFPGYHCTGEIKQYAILSEVKE